MHISDIQNDIVECKMALFNAANATIKAYQYIKLALLLSCDIRFVFVLSGTCFCSSSRGRSYSHCSGEVIYSVLYCFCKRALHCTHRLLLKQSTASTYTEDQASFIACHDALFRLL